MDTELPSTSTNAPQPQQIPKSKGGRYPKLHLKCRGRPKTIRPIKPPKTTVSKTIPLIRKWKPKLQRLVVGRPRKHPQTDGNKRLRGRPTKYSTEDRENHEKKIAEAMLSSQYKLYENRKRYPKTVVVPTLPRNQPNRGCKKLPPVPSVDTNEQDVNEDMTREMATDTGNDETDSIFSDYSDLYEEIIHHDDCNDTRLDVEPNPDVKVVEASSELHSSNSAEHKKRNHCDEVLQEVNSGVEKVLVQKVQQADCEDSDWDWNSDDEVPPPGYKVNGSIKPKKKKFVVPYYNDFAMHYQLRSRRNH